MFSQNIYCSDSQFLTKNRLYMNKTGIRTFLEYSNPSMRKRLIEADSWHGTLIMKIRMVNFYFLLPLFMDVS